MQNGEFLSALGSEVRARSRYVDHGDGPSLDLDLDLDLTLVIALSGDHHSTLADEFVLGEKVLRKSGAHIGAGDRGLRAVGKGQSQIASPYSAYRIIG